jgi:hypothetical protein
MPPIAVRSRLLLYQSTYSAVASSTLARLRQGPRGLISSVLYGPMVFSIIALSRGFTSLAGSIRQPVMRRELGTGWLIFGSYKSGLSTPVFRLSGFCARPRYVAAEAVAAMSGLLFY